MSPGDGAADERLLQFLYQVPVGLLRSDTDGRILNLNPLCTNWLAQLSGGGVPENIFEALLPAVLDLRQRVDAAVQIGCIIKDALFYLPGDQTQILSLDVHRLPGEQLAFVLNDVTGTLTQRQLGLRRDALLRTIFDAVRQHMIVLLDDRGRIQEFNATIARLAGFDASVLGEPLSVFFARAADARALLEAARAHGEGTREAPMLRLDGGGWWGDSVLSRIRHTERGADAYVLVTWDSSERHLEAHAPRERTSRDALTGLLNRRSLRESYDTLRRSGSGDGQACSLLLFELDFLDQLRDRYGGQAATGLIAEVAGRLAATVREQDRIARLSGDEIAILAPRADRRAARALAERCRARVAELPIVFEGATAVAVTLSGGVSTLAAGPDSQGAGFESLYARAEQALNRARELGRNRIEAD